MTIATSGEWQSNVRLIRPNDDGDYVTRVSSTLVQGWQGHRGGLAVYAHGEAARYTRITDLNAFTYEGRTVATWRFSPRLSTVVAASYRESQTTQLTLVGGSGAADPLSNSGAGPPGTTRSLLPLTLARTLSATLAGAYRLTELATGTVDVAYTGETFDSPTLLPGRAVTASGQIARHYGRSSMMLLRAEAVEGTAHGFPLRTQEVVGGWQHSGTRASARLLAGLSASDADSGVHVSPAGIVELGWRAGKGVSSLRYARSVNQALGLGQLLVTDQLGLSYDYATRAGTTTRAAIVQAWSHDAARSNDRLATSDAVLECRRPFRSGVYVGGAVTYRRRDEGESFSGAGTRLSFGYAPGSS